MHPPRRIPLAQRGRPHQAPGPPKPITDDITWTRTLDAATAPRELYRIQYQDRNGDISLRELELRKLGHIAGPYGVENYLGVLHAGKFKTLRADRVLGVEQLSSGHPSSLTAALTYSTRLPDFPLAGAVHRVPTVKGHRTWLVDLNRYTCACPERRQRNAQGYQPGQLGAICPHLARAILEHLPPAAGWQPELLAFLADPRKVHLENLR